jgi:protein tyrosine phosphatase
VVVLIKKLKSNKIYFYVLIAFLTMNTNNFVFIKTFNQNSSVVPLPSSFPTKQIIGQEKDGGKQFKLNLSSVNNPFAWSVSNVDERWDNTFSPGSSPESTESIFVFDLNFPEVNNEKSKVVMKNQIIDESFVGEKFNSIYVQLPMNRESFHRNGMPNQLKVNVMVNGKQKLCPIGANKVVIDGIDQNIITHESPTKNIKKLLGSRTITVKEADEVRAEALFTAFWDELEDKQLNNFCYVTLAVSNEHQGHWLEYIIKEKNCEIGNFKIINLDETNKDGVKGVFRIVKATVRYGEKEKIFTQIIPEFSWPDHAGIDTEKEAEYPNESQIVTGAKKLLRLVAEIEKYRKTNLISINCNAGVGRTGIVINTILAYEILIKDPKTSMDLDYLSMIKRNYEQIILQYEKNHEKQFNKFIEYVRYCIKNNIQIEKFYNIRNNLELLIRTVFENFMFNFIQQEFDRIFVLIENIFGLERLEQAFTFKNNEIVINDYEVFEKIKSIFGSV